MSETKEVYFEDVRWRFFEDEGGEDPYSLFMYETFWHFLSNGGLTSYSNEEEESKIHVYPYVLILLKRELDHFFADRLYTHDVADWDDGEILTSAAVACLYGKRHGNDFSRNADDMLVVLCADYRYMIADVLFASVQEDWIVMMCLMEAMVMYDWFSDEIDTKLDGVECSDDLLAFAREVSNTYNGRSDEFFETLARGDIFLAERLRHWCICHSCAYDD